MLGGWRLPVDGFAPSTPELAGVVRGVHTSQFFSFLAPQNLWTLGARISIAAVHRFRLAGSTASFLPMDKAEYLESIEADSETFISTAAAVPRDNPVAVCPGWTVEDLVKHQVFVWGFATANVAAGTGEKTPPTSPTAPEDDSKFFEWAGSVRATMIETLSTADPDAPAWSFAAPFQTAGFWQRRMCHETMVHRWDIQSVALDIDPLFPHRAADGIDEYTQVGLLYSSSKPDRVYPSQSLHLHCTDTEGEWTMVGDDGPNVTVTKEHAKGDAAVRGQAEELLLWIWGRPGEVEIFGDESVAESWRALAP